MAQTVAASELAKIITKRIQKRLDMLNTKNPVMRTALKRIGGTIEGQTKLNINRKNLIDTGRLINSIRHFVFIRGEIGELNVGSYGVPYAAVHEFGFDGLVAVRAHRRRGRGGTDHPVSAHQRRMQIQEARYLRDAWDKQVDNIPDRLLEAFRKARTEDGG